MMRGGARGGVEVEFARLGEVLGMCFILIANSLFLVAD